jgi:predicted nucleic acid-binding protein
VIVIDSSSLAKYLLREEGWKEVEQYLQKGVLTLDHAKKEVLNAVWKHSKIRHVITDEIAEKLHNTLNQLMDAKVLIVEDENKYVDEAFKIAMEHNLTLYDSLYISQAMKRGQLLTSDALQNQVAAGIRVKVFFIP